MTDDPWRTQLLERTAPDLVEELDVYERQLELMKHGRMDAKVFMETRLRRGAYGQRYDNGQRHDGERTRTLPFPSGDLEKGPLTLWDAPGMQRIKIPFGRLDAQQIDVLAEIAEEYSDGILHITTRQDIQLHYVHIEDTPDLMRRLAAVGVTTREACGNSVRNVTACPTAGVCGGEAFDVSPYAQAVAAFLLGHPDTQDFGRKFKVAFSGCAGASCGLTTFHDLGAIAMVRHDGDTPVRGFRVVVGGGLGAVPHKAEVLSDFVPVEELLPLTQALCRVFARLGEKKNRQRARLKFVLTKLGIDELRRLVEEERAALRHDDRWHGLGEAENVSIDGPRGAPSDLDRGAGDPSVTSAAYETFLHRNVRPQRQPGFYVVTVSVPLGDFTSDQARGLADLCRNLTGDTVRLTVEQNLVFRWVSGGDVPALHAGLQRLGLADAHADTIADIMACPGTDTCKLGISSSRGLALELRRRLTPLLDEMPESTRGLCIKASGCFNSCSQHHIADLGFLGVSRNVRGRRVPHFQMVLGGERRNNGGSFGLAIGAIPAKRVPDAIGRLSSAFAAERQGDETFQQFVSRRGKVAIREALKDLLAVPAYEVDPSYYTDWGDPREYSIGDIGVGECAGEVVPFVEFGLSASELEIFQAQELLDQGDSAVAADKAFAAMVTAAKALVRHMGHEVRDDAEDVVAAFRRYLHDTGVFHDPFVGGKFAGYLLREGRSSSNQETGARQQIDEAQLFLEAAHACYQRLTEEAASARAQGTP